MSSFSSGRLTVIGEALIDLIPAADARQFIATSGGSPFNVAVGGARLGITTSLMARLGDTAFGRQLRRSAQQEGLDLSAAPLAEELTTLAVVAFDDERRATYDFYTQGTADWGWTARELARMPPDTGVLHFGSLASWTEPGSLLIAEHIDGLRTAGTAPLISYDPNVRPLLLQDFRTAQPVVEHAVTLSDVVKASDDDLAWLYPGTRIATVAERWLALGPQCVIITCGAEGAQAFTAAGAVFSVPGAPVKLADTVGAGDSFTSALLSGLIASGLTTRPQLAGAAGETLEVLVSFAVGVSAMTCGRTGAEPPTLAEAEAAGLAVPWATRA